MFGLMHNLYKWVKRKQEKRVTLCIIGLDNAGKTTLLHSYLAEPAGIAVPTFGFNSESVRRREFTVTFYDLGGGGTIRGIWKQYFAEVHGVVFVVDAADEKRFPEASNELKSAIEQSVLHGKPVLVLANKQDLPEARTADELSSSLNLPNVMPDTPHRILHCTALRPDGASVIDPNAEAGWDWLLAEINRQYAVLSKRVHRDVAEQKERQAQELKEKRLRVEQRKAERKALAKANNSMDGDTKAVVTRGEGDMQMAQSFDMEANAIAHAKEEEDGREGESEFAATQHSPAIAHRAARVPEIRFRPEAIDVPHAVNAPKSQSADEGNGNGKEDEKDDTDGDNHDGIRGDGDDSEEQYSIDLVRDRPQINGNELVISETPPHRDGTPSMVHLREGSMGEKGKISFNRNHNREPRESGTLPNMINEETDVEAEGTDL